MKYSDAQRVAKISFYAVKLHEYIIDNKITKDALLTNIHIQWLVTTPLYNIGEQAYYLTDAFKEEHDNVEWNMIAGLRHRLIHDYEGTNWNIIADVVFEEIPVLIDEVQKLI